MWWLWPHFRRVWAAAGTIVAGLLVSYLYGLSSRQPLPDQRVIAALLINYWPWLAASVTVLAAASIVLARAHRRHEAPHFIGAFSRHRRRDPEPHPASPAPVSLVVGREADLARMHDWFAAARRGSRRIVFVAGEAGIGKTTFVRTFINSLAANSLIRLGCGQCIEQYGAGEPYMPILSALTQLGQGPSRQELLAILHRFAPAWLVQMPSLLNAEERLRIHNEAQGVTQPRMLREMAQALEALSARSPLLLLLEDLHWSDFSTLDLIGALARRTEPAQLMIIGTYRPVEMLASEHPLRALKAELELHQQCVELRLPLLNESDVAAYLRQRFAGDKDSVLSRSATSSETPLADSPALSTPQPRFAGGAQNDKSDFLPEKSEGSLSSERDESCSQREPALSLKGVPDAAALAATVYQRSEGNPLFMVNLVDNLLARGPDFDAGRIEPPRNLRQLIERNLERLTPEEQTVLEAASVAGAEFSAASVAAALQRSIPEIEACCTKLARREQFVTTQTAAVTWPDGTAASGFRFHHALYQETLYGRLPAGHRIEAHRRIAEREERAYGQDASQIASELAYHYHRCGNSELTLKYLELAGERAVERNAYREAERHYGAAIALLQSRPPSFERARRELMLQVALGHVLTPTRGFSSAETINVYTRARRLAEEVGGGDSLHVLYGLSIAALTRGQLREALSIADQMLDSAVALGSEPGLALAHTAQANARHFAGELLVARQYCIDAERFYREEDFRGLPNNPRINTLVWRAASEWHLGYADRASHFMDEAMRVGRELKNPFAVAFGQFGFGLVCWLRGDFQQMLTASENNLKFSQSSGFPLQMAADKIFAAYARVKTGKLNGAEQQIREGLAEFDAADYYLARGLFLGWLGETVAAAGALDKGIAMLEEALRTNSDQELLYLPSLFWMRGKLNFRLNSPDRFDRAEADFREAVRLSKRLDAKSDELIATTSLARVLARIGHRDEAQMMLAEIYNWFTEGLNTLALKEARALLDELTS